MSEYDPVLSSPPARFARDREQVEALFERAAGPYLRSPWGWFAWSLALPAASLSTTAVYSRRGAAGVLLLWSFTILLAGLVETVPHLRLRREGVSPLATWALRGRPTCLRSVRALGAAALARREPGASGLWLLLLGHSCSCSAACLPSAPRLWPALSGRGSAGAVATLRSHVGIRRSDLPGELRDWLAGPARVSDRLSGEGAGPAQAIAERAAAEGQ